MKPKKLSVSEIVRQALIWGEESVAAMIDGHTPPFGEVVDSEHVRDLRSLRDQMRAYRNKRFGPRPDPFVGTELVDAMSLKESQKLRLPTGRD